jgi:outer membrane protein TolC
MRVSHLLMLAMLVPSMAKAGPLTFAQALDRATATAPSAVAGRAGIDAARADARAAGSLPDPKLGIGIDNFPISGPPAFTLDRDNMTMERIGIEQDIPNLAKRHAAQAQAGAAIGVAQASLAGRLRQARLGAGLAWIDLVFAERRLAAVDAVLASLRPLVGAAKSGVASGASRLAQPIAVEQGIAALEDRHDTLTAEVASARAELARWTGEPDPQPVGEPPDPDLDPAQLRAALDRNPDLLKADAMRRSAEADVTAARAEKRPDFGVNLAYQHRDPLYGDMVSAGVTISLPLFAKHRQDPRIHAREAALAQADAEREDARRALKAGLDSALADHVMHHAQWQRARDTLVPLAERRAKLETASYAAGRAAIGDVVDAKVALADAQLDALDRQAEVARDGVRIRQTYGSAPQ